MPVAGEQARAALGPLRHYPIAVVFDFNPAGTARGLGGRGGLDKLGQGRRRAGNATCPQR